MAQDIPSWQVVGVNRTDRLYAIVELLRATAPRARAARDLADRFEVSARTIERDISALQQSGVPIWATSGPGGGYSVDPEMTLPPRELVGRIHLLQQRGQLETTPVVRAVETAVTRRKVLELDYVDRGGQRTDQRTVEPY